MRVGAMAEAERVMNDIVERTGIDKKSLMDKWYRPQHVAAARHEWCYRMVGWMSTTEMAKFWGWSDHTGVIHAIARHSERTGLPYKTRHRTPHKKVGATVLCQNQTQLENRLTSLGLSWTQVRPQ